MLEAREISNPTNYAGAADRCAQRLFLYDRSLEASLG